MKALFPKEIIENSQENNFARHTLRSKILYLLILLFLATVILLLPVIKVDVGVRGSGIMRPVAEVITLSAPVSGRLSEFDANENRRVRKGEQIALIDHSLQTMQLFENRERQQLLRDSLSDLHLLLSHAASLSNGGVTLTLKTERHQRGVAEFQEQLRTLQDALDHQLSALRRDSTLHLVDAVSYQTLEERRYLVREARSRLALAVEQQRNRWVTERDTYLRELPELERMEQQLLEEIARHKLLAPVNGTILNRTALAPGSFVFANQTLAELSPDTTLVAEVYIHPKEIGLLRVGMKGRFMVDTYNHTDWGMVTGRITAISGDVIMVDNHPFFRIQCELDQEHLQLSNGFRGDILRGMTFQVRFLVARRSLFQLIRDRTSDWLHPAVSSDNRQAS